MKNLLIFCVLCCVLGCIKADQKDGLQANKPKGRGLNEIKQSGKLIAITDNSTTSYFIYKGQPMGFEYELLERYARHLGVRLEIKVENNLDKMITEIAEGKADLAAANLTVTKSRSEQVQFCTPHLQTRQVLIQRKPANHKRLNLDELSAELIKNVTDLAHKTIHLRHGSAFISRIESLSDEIGAEIKIELVDGEIPAEEMIAMVANGEIDYTVADENIAKLNQKYHDNIDVSTPLSLQQNIAWAVNESADSLANHINDWISTMQKRNDYYTIYTRYFQARTLHSERVKSDYSSYTGQFISPYDSIIKVHSQTLGWDWKLLAAVVFQESKFETEAESWRGAKGLMQIMPETAEQYGVFDLTHPNENIKAGALYLKWICEFWKDKGLDSAETIRFSLASFNVGLGHVLDAQRLADKYGLNRQKWNQNVETYLELKAQPKYYTDSVVNYGYCRGSEPVHYVRSVLEHYSHYINLYANL